MLKRKIFFIGFIVFNILLNNSCNKNNQIVPYVYVDLYVNISLPSYSNLNAIGGWVYVSGGSKGIILYRQTTDQFAAYDRHCTYNSNNSSCGAATVDSTNSFVECTCDGSQYQLYDGLVIQGPATFSLKPYRTSFDPMSNTVHIYN